MGYAFGKHEGIEWGVVMFATRLTKPHLVNCDDTPRVGFGPFARLAMIGTEHSYMTLGIEGGGQLQVNRSALTGAVGATFRGGEDKGFGMHLEALDELALLTASAKAELFLDDYAVLGGVRILPTYGFSFCVDY
jgi:hypothetical protein